MSTTVLPGRRARPAAGPVRARLGSLIRGRTADPAWVRPALFGVLALAAVLCLWNLTRDGYSNEYYAAAAKAGSESWKAWFFGALDPGSFITVDKPPLSLWLSGLSARVLGFSSFSILLPQALCTIAAVGVLYATVRRSFGATAGLIAGVALALTPVTIAIARVNNPDALLVLLLVGSAWAMQRALESGRTRHLAWCGALVGLAFMTKLLQGWMIVPALGAAYLLAGPPRLTVRVRQLLVGAVVMVAVSAAWPVAVSLWPGSTPYIGGSQNGSIWNLIFGYDGFGRLTGGTQGGLSFGGAAGLLRMFNSQVGGQVAWLIPLAAIGLTAGLWVTRRAPRTDLRRAALVLFGVWAAVHAVVFSSQQGIFHPYYVSALAPALAALCGAGAVVLVRLARRSWLGLAALELGIASSAGVSVMLLARTPSFSPALRVAIPVAAVVAMAGAALALRGRGSPARSRSLVALVAVTGAVAVLAGPASYTLANLGRSLSGNNVMAGPASVASLGGFGGGAAGAGVPGPRGGVGGARTGIPGGGRACPAAARRAGGTAGVPGGGGQLSSRAISFLETHQGSATYLVAAVGSQTTAPIIIETGRPVVTIGGFNGGDPAPTVSQLAKMVADGRLRYVLISSSGSGGPGGAPGSGHAGGPGGNDGTSQAIATWVKAHGTAVTGLGISNGTLYRVG